VPAVSGNHAAIRFGCGVDDFEDRIVVIGAAAADDVV
jgi:hypothetical protein